ncbi:MAG TPA: hypothetical protein VJ044_13300, partial [Candidatus Hodarchaeales archaeon]|nr:hypothetical protein [Candidatus Hodarchaeales archaeon]
LFRKNLPKSEQKIFDGMLATARLYASASSAAVRTSMFEGMAMALIFYHFKTLRLITDEMENLRSLSRWCL